jgi:ferredoxin
MAHKIITEKCVSCDACRLACPTYAISNEQSAKSYMIDPNRCNDCSNLPVPEPRCVPHCPVDAIVKA